MVYVLKQKALKIHLGDHVDEEVLEHSSGK